MQFAKKGLPGVSLLWVQLAVAQPANILAVRKYSQQHAGNIVQEFTSFLSLPNVATNPAGLQKNAAFIMEMMNRRAIQKT